ncbi:hypothetical protein GCM10009839_11040 [Catenulispora yoronensis]|uniref:Condensation domain-containing protein n=1 Tax=Catenulispora yoronensis TaxID=450799 RepID=A0ABN2TRZ5_9ACTN
MADVSESEPAVELDVPGVADDRHRVPSPDAEKRILEAMPQVGACVVVAARQEGTVQTDVLLTLRPGADPGADHEPAVRAALEPDEAATVRRVFVVGTDREIPEGLAGDHEAFARWHLAELLGARLPGLGEGVDPVPTPTERLSVEFAGEGEGVAELSWGQREIWQSMTRQGNWLPLGGWKPLDPGTTIADVADELAYLHHRFPSMRTRLRFDDNARPYQVLAASGVTELEIYDAPEVVGMQDAGTQDAGTQSTGTQDTAAQAADQLAAAIDAHYQRAPYDLRTEWPVRMAVVRTGGVPTHMVVVMHHLALDGGAAVTMFRDVATRATEPPVGLQQLQLAQWQYSDAGRRQSDRAMRYFGELLRNMPDPTFPASADPRRPRYWSSEFASPALRSALAMLAVRTGADPARVVMAVHAIALARVTGVNPVLLRPVIGNRFRRQLADVVCHASQAPVVLLDASDATVEEVIGRAGPASMNALKHSFFDPEQLDELTRTTGEDRGVELDVASFVNDRRAPVDPETIPARTAEEFAAARALSTFDWTGRRNDPVERLFVHIDDGPDLVRLLIEADTRALDPAHMEQLARGIEDLAIDAALHPGLDTGVRGPAAGLDAAAGSAGAVAESAGAVAERADSLAP